MYPAECRINFNTFLFESILMCRENDFIIRFFLYT